MRIHSSNNPTQHDSVSHCKARKLIPSNHFPNLALIRFEGNTLECLKHSHERFRYLQRVGDKITQLTFGVCLSAEALQHLRRNHLRISRRKKTLKSLEFPKPTCGDYLRRRISWFDFASEHFVVVSVVASETLWSFRTSCRDSSRLAAALDQHWTSLSSHARPCFKAGVEITSNWFRSDTKCELTREVIEYWRFDNLH